MERRITMKGRFVKALDSFHRGEKGITGLETAIILIAFVTVAAVLAYSVLSAGIFSSQKGQQAVYSGLNSAKASMEVAGGVKASGANNSVTAITFQIHSVLADDAIDMGKTLLDYTDSAVYKAGVNYTFEDLTTSSNTTLSPSDIGQVTVAMTDTGGTLGPYDTFTLELIPATGAAVTIQRTLPGEIDTIMDLH
jgi:flagellin FlaB